MYLSGILDAMLAILRCGLQAIDHPHHRFGSLLIFWIDVLINAMGSLDRHAI
jgi:hypothetical protein